MSTPFIKKRTRELSRKTWSRELFFGSVPAGSASGTELVIGAQETASQGHPWPPPRGFRGWNIGGSFQTEAHQYIPQQEGCIVTTRQSGITEHYRGPISVVGKPILSGVTSGFPKLSPFDKVELAGYGSTAISRVLPTNPVANALNFFGELRRDGLPSVPTQTYVKSHLNRKQKLSGEVLNHEFAVKPFISDIQKFATVARDSSQILEQYRRDSGKRVRRRYAFPIEVEETVEQRDRPRTLVQFASRPFLDLSQASYTVTTRVETLRWFSGCFTYYLDPGDTALGRARKIEQEANKLLGTRLTPQVIYDLTPWSWALDWVSNTGDVIKNLSAFAADGLVMPYGYMMETRIVSTTHTVTGVQLGPNSVGAVPSTVSETFLTTRKSRIPASPFHFFADIDAPLDFTVRQNAILIALGLSGSDRKVGR